MNEANRRIRWQIAWDQYEAAVIVAFRQSGVNRAFGIQFPSAVMYFWDAILEGMLRAGWKSLIK